MEVKIFAKAKRVLFIGACLSMTLNSNLFAASTGRLTSGSSTYKKTDLSAIDSQIESLENLKEYYIVKATRLRNKGDRIRFNSNDDSMPLAEKCWKSADSYDRISDQIQEEINNLEKERKTIVGRQDY